MKDLIQFTKMEGLGNDYVYVDTAKFPISDPGTLSKRISDRHFGIGSDGLILIEPSSVADFRMRIFNADGSEATMCGNGARCIGKYVYDKGLTSKTEILLETGGGVRKLILHPGPDGLISEVTVDMGTFTVDHSVTEVEASGLSFKGTSVNVGNPHYVTFMEAGRLDDIAVFGHELECHPAFPGRSNIEFASVIAPGLIRMRVWERGSAITMACGTGACATAVAAVLNKLVPDECTVRMDGGDLKVRIDKSECRMYMTGPATTVFEGTINT